MINMLIHCESLGSTPALKSIQNSFKVARTHDIGHIWNWTAAVSEKHNGIKNLLIACHGQHVEVEGEKELVGGFGILLGTGIYKENITLSQKLQKKVSNIYLFVCGGSKEMDPQNLDKLKGYNESVNPAYVTNNRDICSQMAGYTEANVYASPATQKYGDWYGFAAFNFGAWEGKVEKFSPYGGVTDVTSRMKSFGKETGDE